MSMEATFLFRIYFLFLEVYENGHTLAQVVIELNIHLYICMQFNGSK